MAVDRELLREALYELVQLRARVPDRTIVLSQLYASALQEWADRLGVESRKLDKLVLVKEAAAPARQIDLKRHRHA